MSQLNVPKASILPALILSAVVGFTFLTLRSYGPESTVRTLHETTRKIYLDSIQGKRVDLKDWGFLSSLFVEDLGSPLSAGGDVRARALLQMLYQTNQLSATYSLAKMERFPNEVRIAVLYRFPDRRTVPQIWVIVRDPLTKQWRISAAKTTLA
jgi:hypothetical protein